MGYQALGATSQMKPLNDMDSGSLASKLDSLYEQDAL